MKKFLLIISVFLFLNSGNSFSQTLQVTLSPDKSKVDRSTKNGTATIFFDSGIEDLSIVCTDQNPDESITKITDNLWFTHIDVKKDIETDGVCYRNYLLKCAASAEYYLTTDTISPNQVLYYTIALPNELEPKLLEEKAKNIAQFAMELIKNGELLKAEQLISACYQNTEQEEMIDETIEMEKALRCWYRTKYGNDIYGCFRIDASASNPSSIWFSNDGFFLYVNDNDANVVFNKYSTETGEKMETFRLPENLMEMLDFDGDRLLTYMTRDSVTHMFDIESRQDKIVKKFSIKEKYALPENVDELFCISSDARMALVQIGNRYVIYDTKSDTIIMDLSKDLKIDKPVLEAYMDNRKTTIAVSLINGRMSGLDLDIEVWNLIDKKNRGKIQMTGSSSSWMRMSPDGTYLFFSDVGTLHYVDLRLDYPISSHADVVKMNIKPAYGMVFSNDGSKMCFFSINSLYLWSFPSRPCKLGEVLKFKGVLWDIEEDGHGHTIIKESDGGEALKSFKTNIKWRWNKGYSSIAASEDCEYLAVAEGNELSVFNTKSGNVLWADTTEYLVSGSCFSSDRKIMCTSSWDGSVRIYDVTSGKDVRKLTGPEERLENCSMSEDDKYVVATDFTGKTYLWLVASGELVDVCEVVENGNPIFPTISSIKALMFLHKDRK